jgi:hypothetical protein
MMKPLSVIPYYGGKSAMSEYINNILDYDNTDTFVTPFGGAARCLLNKPRHSREIYIEINPGLGTLFSVLSKRESGMEFIDMICDETEYSQECFDHYMHVKKEYEDNIPRMVVAEFIQGLCEVNNEHNEHNKHKKEDKLSNNEIRKRFYESFDYMIQYSVKDMTEDGKEYYKGNGIPYIRADYILGRKLSESEETIIRPLEDNMDYCTEAYYRSIYEGERLNSVNVNDVTKNFIKRIKKIAEQAEEVTKEAGVSLSEWYAKLGENILHISHFLSSQKRQQHKPG